MDNIHNPQSTTMTPQIVSISDRRELYKCYMPFIKGGGLFIPFTEDMNQSKLVIGQKIFLLFSMLDSKNKVPIHGKVVWIQKGGIYKGYGIAFGDTPAMKSLKDSIEEQISDLLAKKEPTFTL
jgi:type IV pilus assembly protein PilZ